MIEKTVIQDRYAAFRKKYYKGSGRRSGPVTALDDAYLKVLAGLSARVPRLLREQMVIVRLCEEELEKQEKEKRKQGHGNAVGVKEHAAHHTSPMRVPRGIVASHSGGNSDSDRPIKPRAVRQAQRRAAKAAKAAAKAAKEAAKAANAGKAATRATKAGAANPSSEYGTTGGKPIACEDDPDFVSSMKQYNRQPDGQCNFIKDHVRPVLNNMQRLRELKSPWFHPPYPGTTKGRSGRYVGAMSTFVWVPSQMFGTLQLPCPYCGAKNKVGENKVIHVHAWTVDREGNGGRRISGVNEDFWLVTQRLKCTRCETENRGTNARVPYMFNAANEKSLRMFYEMYPEIKVPFIVASCRTLLTPELQDMCMSLVTNGMNPYSLSRFYGEAKNLHCDRERLRYYLERMHDIPEDGQRKIDSCLAVKPVTAKTYGVCWPGHGLLRHFILSLLEREQDYKFRFREVNVGGVFLAMDHTNKVGKAQNIDGCSFGKYRFTIWSNDLNAPMITVMTETTSFEDPAVVKAVEAYHKIARKDGRMMPMPVNQPASHFALSHFSFCVYRHDAY